MSYGLCKEFPALSPFDIGEKTSHNVIVLFSRVRILQMKENKGEHRQRVQQDVIRRPAGDNWF